MAAPLVLYRVGRIKKNEAFSTPCQSCRVRQHPPPSSGSGLLYAARRDGHYPSLDAEGLYPTSLAASPFILSGWSAAFSRSLLYLLLLWRRQDLERLLPTADDLDRITYKTICIAFPLLTLMIAAGAYWANRTWGSYWSWDPKETWAAITWLVYAGYLHMRITRGWRGRRAAYFAILGFAVVMFTFFGVTYLLPGCTPMPEAQANDETDFAHLTA